jgi:hypothetical protein
MLTLIAENGDRSYLTHHAFFKRLPSEIDIWPILRQLGDGHTVSVTLTDGVRARVMLTRNNQPELFATPVPIGKTYEAQCMALLGLSMTVLCTATDEDHARDIINEVCSGKRSPPAGFQIVLDAGEAEALIDQLQGMLNGIDRPTSVLRTLNAQEVLITELAPAFNRLEQRRLLEYRP